MTDRPAVAVSTLLDQRGITSFHARLIFWSALIALFDGYDIAAISLAAPHLVREWHVDRSALGPAVIGVLAIFWMPESIKYMTLHESQRGNLVKLIRQLSLGYAVPEGARFVVEDEKQFPSSKPKYLFRDGLALITPLLWLRFALNLMGFFFLLSWTPTLLTAAKPPPQTAALSIALLQLGGTVASLALVRWLDRYQFAAITVLFLIAVPVVGALGFIGAGSTKTVLLAACFVAGFCVLGIQSGINVAGALVYPTSLRANGSGWELGVGRIGAIIGPLVGALFVTMPVQQLYMWSALPFLLGAIVCFAIYRLNEARLSR